MATVLEQLARGKAGQKTARVEQLKNTPETRTVAD
jgi:hypothetical protein